MFQDRGWVVVLDDRDKQAYVYHIVLSYELFGDNVMYIKRIKRYIARQPFLGWVLVGTNVEAIKPGRGQMATDVDKPDTGETTSDTIFISFQAVRTYPVPVPTSAMLKVSLSTTGISGWML